MDALDYVLRITKLIQNSTKAIDFIITLINLFKGGSDVNWLDLLGGLNLGGILGGLGGLGGNSNVENETNNNNDVLPGIPENILGILDLVQNLG